MASIQSLLYRITVLANFLLLISISVHSQCLEEQQLKLLHLKDSLVFNSSISTKLVAWNASTDCCAWHGVTCNDGFVQGLDLREESIAGRLDNSSNLFDLHDLESLNLAFNNFNGQIPRDIDKLVNLKYLNLSTSGFTGQIPIEISVLTRLFTLDLSYNRLFYSDFDSDFRLLKLENPNLVTLVQNLTLLRELHLDGVNLSASGKDWSQTLSSSLPNLQVLSLSYCHLSGNIDPSLANLQLLSVIDLSANKFSAPLPEFFSNLSHLTVLHLSDCDFLGRIPETIFQVPTLKVLDLSYNPRLHGQIPEFHQMISLEKLFLSETNFSGTVLPNSISYLINLSQVELPHCNVTGQIPISITNLTRLVYLDFSNNMFVGPIPSSYMAKDLVVLDLSHNQLSGEISFVQWEALVNLSYVNLGYNSFRGSIPSTLIAIPSLQSLELSFNEFRGHVPDFSGAYSSLLKTVDLSSNKLEGPVPIFMFDLNHLCILSLSSNKFNGTVYLDRFQKLVNLSTLDLSRNYLTVEVSASNSTSLSFPSIVKLNLASCNLKFFPDLGNQSSIGYLDLSDNQIRGTVPLWILVFANRSLITLNLSANFLVGFEEHVSFENLAILDLHSNQFQGDIPLPPVSATFVDYSRNNFTSSIPPEIGNYMFYNYFLSLANNGLTGVIPASICNATFLRVLDLSNNNFIGSIPDCLIENQELSLGVLDLRRNRLNGTIADKFRSSCTLQTLDLNGNLLRGTIPKSLSNCNMMEVLDLGNNQMSGAFPCNLKNISSLRVLILRGNKFDGRVECPETQGSWRMLQTTDLSSNQFSGHLPWTILSTGKEMEGYGMKIHDHIQFETLELSQLYYQDSITVTIKGVEMQLLKILDVFTAVDFSKNNFEGPIPAAIGELRALYTLNLSHNALYGQIPSSFGNLSQLESLDLSVNNLTGSIPQQLAGLPFLSFLNLSFNRLVGRIPTSTQLQSFSPSSYQGNEGLYGPPLTETCSDTDGVERLCKLPPWGTLTDTSEIETRGHSSSGLQIDWNFIGAEVGYLVGLGILFGSLVFWKRWRIWYNQQVDCMIFKVFPNLESKGRNQRIRLLRNRRRSP